jgi:tetratricopeptide (TPR) repeat protein
MREEALFEAALALPPEARPAYLDAACGGDAGLRARVERFLAADAGRPGILDADPGRTRSSFRPGGPALAADDVVGGRFRLVRKLGEGGMGEVWVADQAAPVHRAVALKVLRVGLGDPDQFDRFEQERQALALMDHPNIAKVLDAGVADGRPFFAMELIDGAPVTKYCAARGLALRDRLGLFVGVCKAVQHAHQKGIIHRDLKPDNVLVAEFDGRPVPKVIDFGIAKAAGVKLTDDTVRTGFGAIVGTLEYMAPEQAAFDARDVDTRADVYALGVLLYELLTGTTPIRRADFPPEKVMDLLQAIRETDPPRPSQRPGSAAVRGDLDWIAMKCLAKDRSDRYETAAGLARDVERYLANEVVEARPPTAAYRARKFVRRHAVGLAAVAAVALAVVGGGVLAAWQAVRARAAEAEARANERQARAEKERAAEEADIAGAFGAFLQDDLLGQADVANQNPGGRDPNVTVRQLLDRAAGRIDRRFRGRGRTEAAVRYTIGAAYFALGEYTEARTHLDRSRTLREELLGPDHPETLAALTLLGRIAQDQGRKAEAEALLQRALAGYERAGPGHAAAMLVACRLLAAAYADRGRFDRAEALYLRSRDGLRDAVGPDHYSTLASQSGLAALYRTLGQHDKAAKLATDVFTRISNLEGPDHPDTLTALAQVAAGFRDGGDLGEASRLFRSVLAGRRDQFGNAHPSTLAAALDLGQVSNMAGDLDRAEPLIREAHDGFRRRFGPTDERTLLAANSLALRLVKRGRPAEAEPLSRRVVEAWRADPGRGHPWTITAIDNLGEVCTVLGRLDEAAALHQEAARGLEDLGFRHPAAGDVVVNVVQALDRVGRPADADGWRRKWLPVVKDRAGGESADYAAVLADLGLSLLGQRKWAEAVPILQECLAVREKRLPGDWRTAYTRCMLGAAVLGEGDPAAARPLLTAGRADLVTKVSGPLRAARLAETADWLVRLSEVSGRADEAEKWRAERARYPAEFGPRPRRVR